MVPGKARSPLLLAAVLFTSACATQSPFTRTDELDALAKEPLAPAPKTLPVRDVASWTLDGDLPQAVGHVPLTQVEGAFAPVLADAAARQRLTVTADLTCVAEQLGRFELENDGAPGTLLEKFIFARCGTPSAHVRIGSQFGDAPDAHPDAELAEHWGADVSRSLAAVPPGASVGLALTRGNNKARVTLAWAVDEVQLEPVSIFPDGDVVRIRGAISHRVEEVTAAINQGEYDAADCVRNTDVALPRFELACPVRSADPSAWLGVWVRDPGRFLSHLVFETLVWPSRAPAATYTRPSHAVLRDGTPAAFLETLNALRTQLGRPPLQLAGPQSQQVSSLVAPYISASRTQNDTRADRIALGLIAGWKVEGPVTDGQFSSSAVPSSAANELLALMIEQPGGRRQLLSKQARVLAYGTTEASGVIAALVCTYSLIEEPEPTNDRLRTIVDSLNAARQKKGLAPAKWVQLPTAFAADVAREVRAGNAEPMAALRRLMEETSQVMSAPVRGYWLRAGSLDDVRWSGELLTEPAVSVLVTVAPYKDANMPWTSYAILVVTLEGNASTQA
jgi:hypothetical protein